MDNINPKLWGDHGWKFMHYITMSYPDKPEWDDREKFRKFFLNIGDVLPCEKCRVNYKKNLQKFPISENLNNKEDLIRWLINVHNEVNIETGAPEYTYQEFKNEYMKPQSNWWGTIWFVLGAILILFIYRRYSE